MSKDLTRDEAWDLLKKDAYLKQIITTTRQMYPNSRIYTTKYGNNSALVVHISELSREQCTEIGKLIRRDYSYVVAGSNPDYPFFIDVMYTRYDDYLFDVTNLYGGESF